MVDGVVFACCYVDTALAISGETCTFRSALSLVLDSCKDFSVCLVGVREDLLRNVVETA